MLAVLVAGPLTPGHWAGGWGGGAWLGLFGWERSWESPASGCWAEPHDLSAAAGGFVLVTRGIYRWVRHPLYASLMSLLGRVGALLGELPDALVAGLVLAVFLRMKAAREEQWLAERISGVRTTTRGRCADSSRVVVGGLGGPTAAEPRTPGVRRRRLPPGAAPKASLKPGGPHACARSMARPPSTADQAPVSSSAARTVFCMSIAMVIGPTPPGLGVIRPAMGWTAAKATSPTSR